ncbi:MAG: hypothetical protein AAF726_05930 [Planctomycetota bacterium]
MGKKLVTEADVRRMAPGARELLLGPDVIATPAALDLAFSRGMKVVYADAEASAGPSSELWARMKSMDGTYVVQVENGRATVSRLGPSGPEPFGGE